MTYQEKMKWLGRYQAALSYQHMLEDEIEVLRSDAERVTTCMSGMPGRGGPNVNRLPRAVERIEKAQKSWRSSWTAAWKRGWKSCTASWPWAIPPSRKYCAAAM